MPDIVRNESAGEICKTVLRVIGLPEPSNVSESTDATSRQIWGLLTECGQDLLDKHDWQFFTKTHTITTTPGVLEYDLPADFQNYIDDTGWNNTARIPLLGPMTSQQWRLLQARQLGGTTLRLQYQISQNKVAFYFVPNQPQTMTIEYSGRGWARDASDATIYRDKVIRDSDTVMFDRRLIITYLKYRWRQAKGFDSSADEEAYEAALTQAKYNDRPKNTLNISTPGAGYPYLGYISMPDTNYGGS